MKRLRLLAIVLVVRGLMDHGLAGPMPGPDQQPTMAPSTGRIGLAGGMGVDYFKATEIVNRLTGISNSQVSEFVAAAEFFGALTFPVGKEWIGKLEYAYLIAGYSVPTAYGGSDFTVSIHMPTLIMQY